MREFMLTWQENTGTIEQPQWEDRGPSFLHEEEDAQRHATSLFDQESFTDLVQNVLLQQREVSEWTPMVLSISPGAEDLYNPAPVITPDLQAAIDAQNTVDIGIPTVEELEEMVVEPEVVEPPAPIDDEVEAAHFDDPANQEAAGAAFRSDGTPVDAPVVEDEGPSIAEKMKAETREASIGAEEAVDEPQDAVVTEVSPKGKKSRGE